MLDSRRLYSRSSDRRAFPRTASSVHGQRWRSLVPSPAAPLVSPLPSVPPPEPLRASELRDRAREATVLGSLARAEELLQRAVALDPADASVWNDLGVVLVRRGQHPRGIEAIQR